MGAHHKAIGSGLGKACSQADFEAINAALGRMIASVPEGKVMAVYDAFSKLVSSDVPPYLMSTVKEADARAAYSALMEFKDVVKANPITPAAVSAPSNAQIDAAAGKLSAAAYPFLKGIDWSSDLSLTPPGGGATPKAVLQAGGLRRHQCGARQGDCVGACVEGYGRLQRLRQGGERRRSQLPHPHSERRRRQGGLFCAHGVQRRR